MHTATGVPRHSWPCTTLVHGHMPRPCCGLGGTCGAPFFLWKGLQVSPLCGSTACEPEAPTTHVRAILHVLTVHGTHVSKNSTNLGMLHVMSVKSCVTCSTDKTRFSCTEHLKLLPRPAIAVEHQQPSAPGAGTSSERVPVHVSRSKSAQSPSRPHLPTHSAKTRLDAPYCLIQVPRLPSGPLWGNIKHQPFSTYAQGACTH